jgi:hypothetical protein
LVVPVGHGNQVVHLIVVCSTMVEKPCSTIIRLVFGS